MANIKKVMAAVSVGTIMASAPGPTMTRLAEAEDTRIYKVVVNHEEQYSIWPADRENPLGWNDVGKSGSREECAAYIQEVWTDMRPLSLRRRMEEETMRRGQSVPVFNAPRASVTYAGSVAILHFAGSVTIGNGDIVLRNAVLNLLDEGRRKIVLELGHVSSMDESGIGELVSAYTTCTRRGARLRLANVPQNVLDILTITQLITVFDIYDSENDAVTSLW